MDETDDARCPACDRALRPVGPRLACPVQHGMLIATAELAAAVPGLAIVDDGRTIHRCPRCARQMGACLLVAGAIAQAAPHCASHGVWLATTALEALLGGDRDAR